MPLTMLASYPLIIAAQMNDAIKSVKDLIAWAKANPDKSNYPTLSPVFTITSRDVQAQDRHAGAGDPLQEHQRSPAVDGNDDELEHRRAG